MHAHVFGKEIFWHAVETSLVRQPLPFAFHYFGVDLMGYRRTRSRWQALFGLIRNIIGRRHSDEKRPHEHGTFRGGKTATSQAAHRAICISLLDLMIVFQ